MKKLLLASTISALAMLWATPSQADWNVDFSRREQKSREAELNPVNLNDVRAPASAPVPDAEEHATAQADAAPKGKGLFDTIFDSGEQTQELVILQTDHGFVPSTVRVRKNGKYRVSVVNVNEKDKNVSFILEAFSEHHATYYGKIKTFMLEPKKEGTYSFQSPETSAEGKLIVFNPQISVRAPSSAGEEP